MHDIKFKSKKTAGTNTGTENVNKKTTTTTTISIQLKNKAFSSLISALKWHPRVINVMSATLQ